MFFVLFFKTESQGEAEGGGERNPKQPLCSPARAQWRARNHELWDHDLSQNQRGGRLTDWVTQAPHLSTFLMFQMSVYQMDNSFTVFSCLCTFITGSWGVPNVLKKVSKVHRKIVAFPSDYWDHVAWFQLHPSLFWSCITVQVSTVSIYHVGWS